MALNNPSLALGRFLLQSTSPKLPTLSDIPLFSTNLFQLACLLALFVGLNLSFLTRAFEWFFKITEVAPFKPVEVFRKDSFWALHFSLFSSIIFLILCLFQSAVFFVLPIWPFGSSFPWSLLRWKLHKER